MVALEGKVLSLGRGVQHGLAAIQRPEFKACLIGRLKKVHLRWHQNFFTKKLTLANTFEDYHF